MSGVVICSRLLAHTSNTIYNREEARQPIFNKGQSRRIWNELYKVRWSRDSDEMVLFLNVTVQVIDSSDVVVQVRSVLTHC